MNRFCVLFLSGILVLFPIVFGTPALAQISRVKLEARGEWEFVDSANLKYSVPGKTRLSIALYNERYTGTSVDELANGAATPAILKKTRVQLWGEPAVEIEWEAGGGYGTVGSWRGIDWFVIPRGGSGFRIRCGQSDRMKREAELNEWLTEGSARCRQALESNLHMNDGTAPRPAAQPAATATAAAPATPAPSQAQGPSVTAPAVTQSSLVGLEAGDGWRVRDPIEVKDDLKYDVPGKMRLAIDLFDERDAATVDELIQHSRTPRVLTQTRTRLWGEPAIEVEWISGDRPGSVGNMLGIDWFVIPKGGRGLRIRCRQDSVIDREAERDEWINEGRAHCRQALANNLYISGASTPVARPRLVSLALRESAVVIYVPRESVDWDVQYDVYGDHISAIRRAASAAFGGALRNSGEQLREGTQVAQVNVLKAVHKTCSEAYKELRNRGQSTRAPQWAPPEMDPQWYANTYSYTGCYQTGQESTNSQEATVFWTSIDQRYPEYTNAMLRAVIDALALKAARVEMQNAYDCVNAKGGSRFAKSCSIEIQRALYNIGRLPSDYRETYYLRAKTLLLSYYAEDNSGSTRGEAAKAVNRYLEMSPYGERSEELRQVLRKLAGN